MQSNGGAVEQGGQPWVAMPYPAAAAMVMPHGMAAMPYPAPYMPYPGPQHYLHQQQQGFYHNRTPQHSSGNQNQGSNGENKTIWVGDLQNWMSEDYLRSCFSSAGEVTVKLIRNKHNQMSEGYGFVEFTSHEIADNVLQTYTGKPMPNDETTPFRLNWATFSMGDKRGNNNTPDLSIFVGDLAPDVDDNMLHETFSSKYESVKAAKVVMDANTGRSKGYGFVRFGDENERALAMSEMNGVFCSSRAMRIGAATPRKSSAYQHQGGYVPNGVSSQGSQSDGDSANTTIFVGGLDPNVTDEVLRQPFSQYGEILSVKIPVGKGCGFVQFSKRNEAEEALQNLSGTTIGNQSVRLSWGRNPGNKQASQTRSDFGNQWNGSPYYGGQMYESYGYAVPPPHDPRMYAAAAAAAYGAYPMYGSPQQQVN